MLIALRRSCGSFGLQRKSVTGVGKVEHFAGRRKASTLAQMRRRAEKKNLHVKPDPNAHFFTFPRERLGLDYTLNAVLNGHHRITPYGEAYRNLFTRHLLMLTKGKLDEHKALIQESDEAAELKEYYVANPELNKKFTPGAGVATTSDDTFRKLGRLVADHIGNSDNVFVLDAAVGSHRLGEVKVRVITNDANVNLYLKHLFPRSANVCPTQYLVEHTVYVAPDLLVKDEAALGLKSKSVALTNLDRAITLIAGSNSNQGIKEAIVAAISSRVIQNVVPSLGLANAALFQSPTSASHTALVFDPSHQMSQLEITPTGVAAESAAKPKKGGKTDKKSEAKTPAADASATPLYTAKLQDGVVGLDGALWNHDGLYRMFQGITHTNTTVPRQRADIVEHTKKSKQTRITQSLKDLPSEVASPKAIVFVIADQNALLPAVSKLTLAQASKFFTLGYNGAVQKGNETAGLTPYFSPRSLVSQPGQYEALFQELASLHSAHIYVVNTHAKAGQVLSTKDVHTLVAAAANGSLASAKSTPDPIFKFQTISQVPGVTASLDVTQGWNKQEYQTQASKLASLL